MKYPIKYHYLIYLNGKYLNKNNDKFDEQYEFDSYLFGDSPSNTLEFKYLARWSSGFGQEHNGNVERLQTVNIENHKLKMTSYFKSHGKKGENKNFYGAQCLLFSLDIPSVNYKNFLKNKKIIFQGYSSTCEYVTTSADSDPVTIKDNLCGIRLIQPICIQALFPSDSGFINDNNILLNTCTRISTSYSRGDASNKNQIDDLHKTAEYVYIPYWFGLHINNDEGDNLNKPIHRISYFNFTKTGRWKNYSKDFIYDNAQYCWSMKCDDITDDYYADNGNFKRLYFMVYINRIKSTYKYITLTNFNIIDNQNKSLMYFNIFNNSGINYNNGIGTWHKTLKYNIFYSYAFDGNGFGGAAATAKSPTYIIKYVPHIKVSNNNVSIASNVYTHDSGIQNMTEIYTYYIGQISNYNNLSDYLDIKYIPNSDNIYIGPELITTKEYNSTMREAISAQGFYEDLENNIGYTSVTINLNNVCATFIETTETDTEPDVNIYNYKELNPLGNINIGKVYFNKSKKEWETNCDLMLKPVLYETVKFVYDNLINNAIQGQHGCPSETGIPLNSILINCQGLTCLSSENILWYNSQYNKHTITEESIYNTALIYQPTCFTNIPIIKENGTDADLRAFDYVSSLTNINSNPELIPVPILTSFFGIKSDIAIYDISIIDTNKNNISQIWWKANTFAPNINSLAAYNIDRIKGTALSSYMSGYLFETLEQVKSNTQKFTTNPYSLSYLSGKFKNIFSDSTVADALQHEFLSVSIGSTPKFTIIPYNPDTTDGITSSAQWSIISANSTGIEELLSSTYQRINYYCDRLSSVINNSWHNTTLKPYSYKDLTTLTDTSTLASAILQYKFGNSYINEGEPVNQTNIITKNLGTLTKYNWINWINITDVNQYTLFNATTVNYTRTDNYKTDWISKKYDINKLIH